MNSLYPMLATGVMAGFGFFFWLFAARLFTDEAVGLAATLISVMTMISTLALVGFDTSTIRFLAKEKRKNESITTGMIVISGAAFVLSTLFVLGIGFISPKLAFIQEHTWMAVSFVIFAVLSSLNTFTDAVFLAYRKTKFTFIIDTLFSILKVALPFFMIPWGAFGIFAAAAFAQTFGVVLSVFALIRHFDYRPTRSLDRGIVTRVWRYSAGNYLADVFNFLPLTVLPIIITNRLGPEQAAYYFIVMMITALLYVIPASAMRALFAEGSFDESRIGEHMRGALKTSGYLLLPAIMVLLIGGELILSLFGTDYSIEGLSFLYVMTLTSIPVTAYALYGSLFRLTQNVLSLIARNIVFAVSILVLVYVWLPYGLVGIGAAYATGNILASVLSHFFYVFERKYMCRYHAGKTPEPFTLDNLIPRVRAWSHEFIIWPFAAWCDARITLFRYCRKHPNTCKTLLCYPEKPKWSHVLYKICPRIGWKITDNPTRHADLTLHFEDVTKREPQPLLDERAQHEKVWNHACKDISKKYVDEVFRDVFGYQMSLDPRTHTGTCVRKSDRNAVHDGTVLTCPTEPEEGYVYQKLIDTTTDNNQVVDLRIPVFGDIIPFVLKRYKSTEDIFDVTIGAEFTKTADTLSNEEHQKVLTFAQRIGLDYGEIDALRSNDDGRLYLIDVNNTPNGPSGPIYHNEEMLAQWHKLMCEAAQKALSR